MNALLGGRVHNYWKLLCLVFLLGARIACADPTLCSVVEATTAATEQLDFRSVPPSSETFGPDSSGLPAHSAQISLNGNKLPLTIDPARRVHWMKEKFPQADENAVFDNTKSFFVRFHSPEEVLGDAKVSEAISILSRFTENRDGVPAPVVDQAKTADAKMSLWLPPDVVAQLKDLGVTAATYQKDSEGNKLLLSLRGDRVVGYDAIVTGLRPGETAALKQSGTGFTAAPSTRGTAQPSRDFSIVMATRPDGKVEVRDMFAGAYAESGPPTIIAEMLFEGKHLPRPEKSPLPPRNQREQIWKARVAAALERYDLDAEAWRLHALDPSNHAKPPPETQYAQFWTKQELTDGIAFWATRARANGESQGAVALSEQARGAIPEGTRTFEAALPVASVTAPFLPAHTRHHIGQGEIVLDATTGKTRVEGMHLFEHYSKALERGDGERPGDRPDLVSRLEKTELMTVDESGKRVKSKDDNAKNMKGLVANMNPDGVTVTVRMSMDGPDGVALPFKPCTLFPPKWKMEHVDAAAALLMGTSPNGVGASGTRSYFGYFPADPNRPIGPNNPKFGVQMFVGADGDVFTVFSPGTFQPVEVR